MKICFIFLLSLFSINAWALDENDLTGSWFRTYGVFSPWSAGNSTKGSVLTYDEKLDFHPDNLVYISDSRADVATGKSMYMIMEKDDKDFIVFYSPNQDPMSKKIQETQGYYVMLKEHKDGTVELDLFTMSNMKKGSAVSVNYNRVEKQNNNVAFITPKIILK